MTDRIKEIENLLPDRLKNSLFSGMFGFRVTYDGLEEIRLRCAQPPEIRFKGKDYRTDKVIIAPQDIRQCLEYMSHYSLYAFQEEIRQGYLTVRGGHRIGVLGHAVLENGIVTGQTSLSFLNIRVAHEKIGCADTVMDFVCKDGVLKHTLIISPPCCGKTTLLRDIVRQLSQGSVIPAKRCALSMNVLKLPPVWTGFRRII